MEISSRGPPESKQEAQLAEFLLTVIEFNLEMIPTCLPARMSIV